MTDVLAVRDVLVAHAGRTVLDVPGLGIGEGAHVAIMGPNGAGKSTLLRVLALLQQPTGGEIRFRGRPVPTGRAALSLRRRMAVVLQAPPLANTTVHRNVAMGLQFRGVRGAEADRRVRQWLERFGIERLADRKARSLSGGEAQRACLARAFVLEPEVLLLDEPFAALDGPTRDSLLSDLEAILREANTTVVTVTHDRDEATRLADALVVLVHGKVRAAGAKDALLRQPPNRETAELFGFTVLPCGNRLIAVPPHRLSLEPGGASFDMTVQRVIELGYARQLLGFVGGVTITLDVPAEHPVLRLGDRVVVYATDAVPLPDQR